MTTGHLKRRKEKKHTNISAVVSSRNRLVCIAGREAVGRAYKCIHNYFGLYDERKEGQT